MKTWKNLREGAPSFVREPAAKAFWNKSVLLNPKNFSEPTKDDKVFKATNINGPSGKVHGAAKDEDQSQGYHRPIMFGDYLNHLLSMEATEWSEDAESFVEAVTEMNDEQFVSFMEETIPEDLAELWAPSRLPDYVSSQAHQAASFHAAHSHQEKAPIHNALRAKALEKWHSKLKPGSKKVEDVVGSMEAKREAMKIKESRWEPTPEEQAAIKAHDAKEIAKARAARKAKGKPGVFGRMMNHIAGGVL